MAQASVTIAGQAYRIACNAGEEGRLTTLATMFDGRISELRSSFGEIGDQRLHVMAALMVADDLDEAKKRIAMLERQIASLEHEIGAGYERIGVVEDQLADAVVQAAERIERIARSISPPSQVA